MTQPSRMTLEEAYLLHRRSYRETSLILEFFTRSQGRVTLLGKGVRRRKSMQAAVIWPFAPLAVSWSGRGELPVLTAAEPLGPALCNDSKSLACGLYLNELLLQLLAPRDPYAGIFDLYGEALNQLAASSDIASVLRLFELSFLEALGYGLILDREMATGLPIQADRYYEYRPEHGPVESGPSAGTIRGSTLMALKDRNLNTATVVAEAKRLMRQVLAHQLGGRPLRSRELFKYGSPR